MVEGDNRFRNKYDLTGSSYVSDHTENGSSVPLLPI